MNYQKGIEVLIKERNKYISEKKTMIDHYDGIIKQLESTLEILSGKRVWEIEAELQYDDENPDYIKGSQEE